MNDSAPGSSSNTKLHMVLGRLPDGISDDDPQKIRTTVDEMELHMPGDGRHNHPTVA